MAFRVVIRALVILAFLPFGARVARAQDVGPDSLVKLGIRELANGHLDSAKTLFQRALRAKPHDAAAAVGLARVALARGDEEQAERLFAQAESWEPNRGHREYGQGLLALAHDDRDDASAKFQAALRKNPRYVDAIVEIARLQAKSWTKRFAAKRTYQRAIEIDPSHPTAYLELGRLYAASGDMDNAISYYEDQLRVNPNNAEAMTELGFALLEKGRYWHARQRLFGALQYSSGNEVELTLALAATYMGDRQFARAHDTYAQAFQLMPEDERAYYEDISEIATVQEVNYLRRISGEQKLNFLKKFWLRRDPTPITVVNERMLEHFRRVWYARTHFSEGRTPWDDRGKVYIRYGEPDHRSTSSRPNFSTNRDVDVVRERYLHAIYGPSPPDILLRGTLPAYPLIDPKDLQEADPNAQFLRGFLNISDTGDESSDMGDGSGFSGSPSPPPETPQFGAETGIASLTRWEEWTYTTVGNGLQITFVDRIGNGDYQFATPPPTSDLQMASTLRQYAPEEQFNLARHSMPERYVYDATQDPLDFYYYLAQFRSPDGTTQLDIYYGLPISELTFQENPRGNGYRALVESGLAVFDTLWNVKGRMRNRVQLQSPTQLSPQRGSIHVDKRTVLIPGGQRVLLSVQAKDLVSGRLQAYRENVNIERFDSTSLAMSDIVLAGLIRPADSTDAQKFVRNGLYILPMASRSFRRGQPIYVYFEIYNLTRGEEFGETEYEVEHAIRTGGTAGGSILGSVGRILGGTSRRVGVSRVIEGIRAAEYQDFQLNTSTLSPGLYTLIITVHDLKSDRRVTKERTFYIGE